MSTTIGSSTVFACRRASVLITRLTQQETVCKLRRLTTSSSHNDSGDSKNSPLERNDLVIKQTRGQLKITDTLRQNVNWFNGQYERVFGIDEIRQMQDRVLEAESNFLKITQSRKLCQDKIENLKEGIKNIRDKLDITARQSDNYLKLITEEHKLLREQLSHDAQLSQLKDQEQLSLDTLSKLLRQSHELERLRQERAKYWQLISLGLSVVSGVVALFAQKVRNQRTTLTELKAMNHAIQALNETTVSNFSELVTQISALRSLTSYIADKQQMDKEQAKRIVRDQQPVSSQSSWLSWLAYIPGYGFIKSKLVGP